MASRTQEEILAYFREASGGGGVGAGPVESGVVLSEASLPNALQEATKAVQGLTGAGLPNALQETTKAVQGLTGTTRIQEGAIGAASQILTSTSGPAQGGGSSTASKVVSAVLKSGLGFAPVVQGIARLFGGGSEPELPALPRYEPPPAVRFERALRNGVITDADYDQTGAIRTPGWPPAGPQGQAAAATPNREANGGAGYGEAPRAVVNVNVQAMDSRSFLDHSQEIARAVREAMLNLNSINDVVNDL